MNKKIILFVEGASEAALVVALLRKKYWNKFKIFKSFLEFVDAQGGNEIPLYIIDCEGVQRIGPAIENRSHIFKNDLDFMLFTLGDVEEAPGCYAGRKKEILKEISSFDPSRIRHVFSKPYLEDLYWHHPDDIIRCFKKMYKTKFDRFVGSDFEIGSYPKTQGGLKKIFVIHNMTYMKPIFAENFFNGFEFDQSTYPTILRLLSFLDMI